jgi:hypothetical protein
MKSCRQSSRFSTGDFYVRETLCEKGDEARDKQDKLEACNGSKRGKRDFHFQTLECSNE